MLSLMCDRYKARKLNKICSGNLFPFYLESIVERILATTNNSRLGDNVSTFSKHFQHCRKNICLKQRCNFIYLFVLLLIQ